MHRRQSSLGEDQDDDHFRPDGLMIALRPKKSQDTLNRRFDHALHLRSSSKTNVRATSNIKYETGPRGQNYAQKENIPPQGMYEDSKKPPVSYSNSSNRAANGGIPLLRRARSALKQRPGSPAQLKPLETRAISQIDRSENKSPLARGAVSPDPFGDRQVDSFQGDQTFGVQVSISGGPVKPKKTTLAERAAKFGGQALLRSVSRKVKDTSEEPPPVLYTVVRSPSTKLSRAAPRNASARAETYDESETSSLESVAGTLRESHSAATLKANTRPVLLQVPKRGLPGSQEQKPDLVPSRKPVSPSGQPLTLVTDFDDYYSRTPSPSSFDSSSRPVAQQTEQEPDSQSSYSTEVEEAQEMYPGKPTYPSPPAGPVSRFSWTTVGTNAASLGTNAASGVMSTPASPPPLPSPGESMMTGHSIMARRRPLPSQSLNQDRPSSRKSAVSSPATEEPEKPCEQESQSPVSVKDKALPLPPTVDQKRSRVEALQAKKDELDLRISNVERVLKEVEKVDKASPLEVTERMRRANRKRMEEVRTAMEDARRERHEVGCALARAYSKIQKEEGVQSALWLWRITED